MQKRDKLEAMLRQITDKQFDGIWNGDLRLLPIW